MRIHEIIREKRLEFKMTQEQMAERLGVTAPAVNKWEKGASYPDITLLPPIARLLGVDLNTLLSFKEELTREEAAAFSNELCKIIMEQGFDTGYKIGMEKLSEYPTCDYLWYMTALTLDGAVIMYAPAERDKYAGKFEAIYERLSASHDPEIAGAAKHMLVAAYMSKKEYDKAENVIESIPKRIGEKTQLLGNLYMEQEKYKEAAELFEGKVMRMNQEILAALMGLMKIAVKENRTEDAEYILKKMQDVADIFEMWGYGKYCYEFELAYLLKDTARCLTSFKGMMETMKNKWQIPHTPLYGHLKRKEDDGALWKQMGKSLTQWVREDAEAEFLKESPEFMEMLEEYERENL